MPIARPRPRLISGPVLVGFNELFAESYGRETKGPYPKITPSRIGDTLLPFPCPHCDAVRSVAVDPKKGRHYYSAELGHSWCPACRGRYHLDTKGTPSAHNLPAGATHAPAIVTRGKRQTIVGLEQRQPALILLGAS